MKKFAILSFALVLLFAVPFPARAGAVEAKAQAALLAFKTHNGAALAKLAHPEQGVRFTPYPWDDVPNNVVLKPKEVAGMYASKKKYVWGVYDGSGDPISLTPADYAKKFIWTADFTRVKDTSSLTLEDMLNGQYSYLSNGPQGEDLRARYPKAVVFIYHFPGVTAPEGGGMDWSSLFLIYVPVGSDWFLVGVVHNEWLI
jgi:hypothetical protein